MKSKFFPALATLVGTTIGAGFLGIPYVVSKSGFIPGVLWIFFSALLILLTKLYLGEVILRTKGNHQLTGYAETYLGKKGKVLMFLAMLFGIYSALVAYLIGEGKSLSFLIFGNFSYSFIFSLAFWLVLANLTYIGLRALKKYEKASMIIILSIIFLVFVFFVRDVKSENLSYIGKDLFFPLGVVLFSFLGFSAIPEVKRILLGKENLMKKVIFLGILIPFVVYLIFTFVVVGVFGFEVKEIATLSIGRGFSILGILTMFTAFFALSIAIRDMFRFDFGLGRFRGWLLCSVVPLILFLIIYFFELASFIQILSIGGIVSGGLTGILALLMNLKAKQVGNRKPEYSIEINKWVIVVLSLIFLFVVILELFW